MTNWQNSYRINAAAKNAFVFQIFLGYFNVFMTGQRECDMKGRERGGTTCSKWPQAGFETGCLAARTQPLHMVCPLYHCSILASYPSPICVAAGSLILISYEKQHLLVLLLHSWVWLELTIWREAAIFRSMWFSLDFPLNLFFTIFSPCAPPGVSTLSCIDTTWKAALCGSLASGLVSWAELDLCTQSNGVTDWILKQKNLFGQRREAAVLEWSFGESAWQPWLGCGSWGLTDPGLNMVPHTY